MKQLSDTEAADWLALQGWLALSNPNTLHFEPLQTRGLTKYEGEIVENSASESCYITELFFVDAPRADFPGGLFWIARPDFADKLNRILVEQVLRAGGLTLGDRLPEFVLIEPDDYDGCLALVALTMMLGWDASLVLAGRRILITIDDEPFPALISDHADEHFLEAAKIWGFEISPL